MSAALLMVAVVGGLVGGFLVGRALTVRTMELAFQTRERAARRDSVHRSRSTLKGRFLEALAPNFPDFPYDPTELRFLGTPVDYVVFRGLNEGRVADVVFLEVKSGRSHLSPTERSLREVIDAGAVAWDEYRIAE